MFHLRSTAATMRSAVARSFQSSAAPRPQMAAAFQGLSCRSMSTQSPLDAFRDPVDRQTRMQEPVGRQWTVQELRRKSYDDLHKLWYVLYKERNMLLTERQLSRRRQIQFPQPQRMRKVQKSMGAVKHVLGERKRSKIAAFQEERAAAMMAEAEMK